MEMAANIPAIIHALRQMTMQTGQIPAELHVNTQMRNLMAAGIAALDPKMAHMRKLVLKKFMGVKVVVNDAIPDNGIAVRPLHMMDREDWLSAMHDEFTAKAEKAEEKPASLTSPDDMEKLDLTADDFVAGKPRTVTDVLIESMTSCDDVRGVIVLEVRGMENVYLRSNMSRFETFGVLTSAVTRVAQGE